MNTKEMEELFDRLARRYGMPDEAAREIFTLLVKITLKYRDMLAARGETPLTVDEVKQAIDILLRVMGEKKFPAETPERITQLVNLWYEEIKPRLYH